MGIKNILGGDKVSKLNTVNFHRMEGIEPEQGQRSFILGCWRPKKVNFILRWLGLKKTKLIGVQLGLLCEKGNGTEIYICVSYNDNHDSKDNFKDLKVDYLFYAQRDAYAEPPGIADILSWQMLPQGEYFEVSKDKPVYIKVGIVSPKTSQKYDAFCNLYYKK